MLQFLPLLEQLNHIQGWLAFEEGDLLISTTLRACINIPGSHNIVEVGSYHGKSTILLGSVVKEFFPSSMVYAIDPHEGVVGAQNEGFQAFPPSLNMFRQNMERLDLTGHVELVHACSYNIKWDKPITFLFVDGLHDYLNVARDFNHFEAFVTINGYVAFHDYGDYYADVKKFVQELLATGTYVLTGHAKSLVVLQKLR